MRLRFEDLNLAAPMLEFVRRHDTFGTPLARSSSRLGHGPLKAGARVRVPYALPSLFRLGRIEENSFWSRCVNDREACETH